MRLHWQGPSLVVRTPAKLNLFLDVLGKRPDGYHELETMMVSVGLYDTLRFEANGSGRLVLSLDPQSPGLPESSLSCFPVDGDNLILKAAELLRQTTGCTHGISIHLKKTIPLQAGMGGGSSDAAATLVALNEFWKLGLHSAELHRLASQLGSDLNFFVDSTPLAICRGRGEQVEAVPLNRPLHFVIVKPPVGLSTRDVFRALNPDRPATGTGQILAALHTGNLSSIGERLHNSLEAPALCLSPEVGGVLARLDRISSLGRLMTGSGSACYALCSQRGQALRASHQLRGVHCGQVYVVQTAT